MSKLVAQAACDLLLRGVLMRSLPTEDRMAGTRSRKFLREHRKQRPHVASRPKEEKRPQSSIRDDCSFRLHLHE